MEHDKFQQVIHIADNTLSGTAGYEHALRWTAQGRGFQKRFEKSFTDEFNVSTERSRCAISCPPIEVPDEQGPGNLTCPLLTIDNPPFDSPEVSG